MLWCIPTMCVCAFLVCSVCTSFRLGEGAKLAKPPMLISRCLLHAAERPPPPAPTSECLLQQLFLVIISTELFNTLSSPHSLYLPLYSLSGALKGSSNDIMFIAATFHSDFFLVAVTATFQIWMRECTEQNKHPSAFRTRRCVYEGRRDVNAASCRLGHFFSSGACLPNHSDKHKTPRCSRHLKARWIAQS